MLINGKDGDGDTPLHIALRREGEPDSTKEVPSPDEITDIVNSIRSSISKDLVYPVAIAHYLIRYVRFYIFVNSGNKQSIENSNRLILILATLTPSKIGKCQLEND